MSAYGQTETSPGNTMPDWKDDLDTRCTSVGYPFPYVNCKIINPTTGNEVPPGNIGEFCSKGYNTMKGYYKMPEETAKVIDKDGWLHSGDLAFVDNDGNFHITGRLKDLIIRGGENISLKEIEEIILTNSSVLDVQVFAVPDEK